MAIGQCSSNFLILLILEIENFIPLKIQRIFPNPTWFTRIPTLRKIRKWINFQWTYLRTLEFTKLDCIMCKCISQIQISFTWCNKLTKSSSPTSMLDPEELRRRPPQPQTRLRPRCRGKWRVGKLTALTYSFWRTITQFFCGVGKTI